MNDVKVIPSNAEDIEALKKSIFFDYELRVSKNQIVNACISETLNKSTEEIYHILSKHNCI